MTAPVPLSGNEGPSSGGAVAWRWRVEGVGPWITHHGTEKPSFSMYQPGEVYDLQPLYAHPVQDAEMREALTEMRAWALEMIGKHADPNGTAYEQGQQDMGHRWVLSLDKRLAALPAVGGGNE